VAGINIQVLDQDSIGAHLPALASLRVAIFREYPYLYQGTIDHELREVLPIYARSQRCVCVIAQEGDQVIGVAVGVPLAEMDALMTAPLSKAGMSVTSIFCLGELLVVREFRGQGIGRQLYAAFEKQVRLMIAYRSIAMYEIDRAADAAKPTDYRSLDPFWRQRGFVKHPELSFTVPWTEVGDTQPSEHRLVFWIKSL
jgi:GNAT superfamily N-acetyltransferase